ncbi:hypothetical protein H5410_051616 [Solanum commersonii]|uniref:Uncharacterized protein n=1 Tax=Solanum commersonii TaxID=4109 RepID=A0A9J5X0L1_SOLCO|nr:hypothetical protein H5410_051616 [Solanum commersonii]
MNYAIAASDDNPLSLFNNEQAKKLIKLNYESPVMKVEYEKKKEQARTRQKEIILLSQEKDGKIESTSNELVTTKMEMDGLRKHWSNIQDSTRARKSYQDFLTEEDRKKLDDSIKSEARWKVKYEKREEQGRELEELLQHIRTRHKENMDERQEGLKKLKNSRC